MSHIAVRNVTFSNSWAALRIKTYQGGHGLVSSVSYNHVAVVNVRWPIIIDQVGHPFKQPAKNKSSNTVAIMRCKQA